MQKGTNTLITIQITLPKIVPWAHTIPSFMTETVPKKQESKTAN